MKNKLEEGVDYTIDSKTGYLIFTSYYLEKRGYCCGNGCKNCPFFPRKKGNKVLKDKKMK